MKSDWMAGRVAVYLAVDMVLGLAVPARARGVSKGTRWQLDRGPVPPHNGFLLLAGAENARTRPNWAAWREGTYFVDIASASGRAEPSVGWDYYVLSWVGKD